jgi:hypothetical protein
MNELADSFAQVTRLPVPLIMSSNIGSFNLSLMICLLYYAGASISTLVLSWCRIVEYIQI